MQEYTNDLGDSRMRQHHLMSWIFKMSRKLEFNTPQERNSMTRCFQVPVKISTADSSSSTKTKCSNEYHIDKKTTYLAFQSNKHFFFWWGFGERFRICTLMDKNVYEKARGHSIDTAPLSTVKWNICQK